MVTRYRAPRIREGYPRLGSRSHLLALRIALEELVRGASDAALRERKVYTKPTGAAPVPGSPTPLTTKPHQRVSVPRTTQAPRLFAAPATLRCWISSPMPTTQTNPVHFEDFSGHNGSGE